MLSTDMAMGWNLNYGCNVTGTTGSCAVNNNLMPVVKAFAKNDNLWYSVFNRAWTKLTSMGYSSLTYNEQSNYGDGTSPASYKH